MITNWIKSTLEILNCEIQNIKILELEISIESILLIFNLILFITLLVILYKKFRKTFKVKIK